MRIFLHIGLEHCGAGRIQKVLADRRGQLLRKGVLFPRIGGALNQTRLFMAVSDPEQVGLLRHSRGLGPAPAQARLYDRLGAELAGEVARHRPRSLILSAAQLASLPTASALERLRALLAPLGREIVVIAHLDEPARLLVRHYADAIRSGRTAPLERELELARAGKNWRDGALALWRDWAPERHDFPEVQAPPFWLDYAGLARAWEAVFGPGALRFRGYDPARFQGPGLVDEIREAFEIADAIGKPEPPPAAAGSSGPTDSAVSLARARRLNRIFRALVARGKVIAPPLWRRLLSEVARPGPPTAPGSLAPVSEALRATNAKLLAAHPGLPAGCLEPDPALPDWREPDPEFGFRASQYAAAFLPRIDKATREARAAPAAPAGAGGASEGTRLNGALSPVARRLFSPAARENFLNLSGGRFEPHNRLAPAGEDRPAPAFEPAARRPPPAGSSGRVIVGCMKDEAPYILEWIAYHRAIGVDNFLIYTNGCSDGTPEILERLQELGIAQHRDNSDWRGNSPQQHALNRALAEPLVRDAEWLIHIDVDEYINIRIGNGTIDDFLARVPEATNVAMTWRLFGHNGITRLADDLVIAQFDRAAPSYCPKPHTVWGFKSMVKNIGAYGKLSCHRPNKLDPARAGEVRWVNGSGREMGPEVAQRGWRSSLRTIGYDLIQLNHYALRSAESYLIKRQRGRALHVDRAIGLNYWIRMDWSDCRDLSIQRNIPRLRAELARLKADPQLDRLHRAGFDWHRRRADELHRNPEFEALYRKALETRLTPLERVAFSLALDVDN